MRVLAVVTNPDKRRSRGSATSASPVKEVATARGLPVLESTDAAVDFLGAHGNDGLTGVVVAYGRIIREPLLSMLPLVNLHFSLLPRWRGAAPVERAILAGDTTTGSSIMQIEEGLDTGAVYAVDPVEINDDETADELRGRLGRLGAARLVDLLRRGFPVPLSQSGVATHADKIRPEELAIDFAAGAIAVKRLVRIGGAHCSFRGQRLKVHRVDVVAAAGEPGVIVASGSDGVVVGAGGDSVRLVSVQPEGKKAMSARDWANGVRPSVGESFGRVYGESS